MQEFEVELLTKDLVSALNLVAPIIEKRNVISVLSCARIVARDNFLEITVTNETVLAKCKIGADIRKTGEIAVDVATFLDVIRKLSPETINLNLADNQLVISADKCNFGLNILSTEKFPDLPEPDNHISSFEIQTQSLVDLVKYTEFAMLTNETRYNLNGIVLHTINSGTIKKIAAAATDGHRLSAMQIPENFECNAFNVLLPAKLAHNIPQIFQDPLFTNKTISVKVDTNKIEFATDNFRLISKLVNATFPEYGNLIPKGNKNILKINTKILADAINRVTTVSTEKFRAVKFHITSTFLEALAYSETKGRAKEIIVSSNNEDQLYTYEGDELKIAFNSKYLQDIVGKAKGSILTIALDTDIASVVCSADKIPGATFVVMPVKI